MKDTNYCGSSETIREALNFNFIDYYNKQPKHIKNIDELFLQWFIGFSEADGSFIILKNFKIPRLCFSITQKNSKVLFKIKKNLGFGKIKKFYQNGEYYYKFSVYKLENIERLIYIFNGNIVLTKVYTRFYNWVIQYNILCNHSLIIKTINFKKIKVCFNLNSAWFAGFIEGDGGFYASLTKNSKYKLNYRLRMKFYITQKYELELLENVIQLIHKKYLESKYYKSNLNNSKYLEIEDVKPSKYITHLKSFTYRLEISTEKYILIILQYLNKYPLQGEKNIVFLRWKRIFLNKNTLKNAALKSNKSFIRFKKLVKSIKN
uniref:hypothetical protein n=1 Tax=Ulva meridionalis TaxID=434723 RepID=UPI0028E0A3AD|nr:hypothetical protein NQY40_pgp015 [Ulva meridionalis]WFS80096.1 hypothetical protein [Ulva meridionalis]